MERVWDTEGVFWFQYLDILIPILKNKATYQSPRLRVSVLTCQSYVVSLNRNGISLLLEGVGYVWGK